jgi:hypothetical protein
MLDKPHSTACTLGRAAAPSCRGGISNLPSATMRATSGRRAISSISAGSAVTFIALTIQKDLKGTFLPFRKARSDCCELDAVERRLRVTCSPWACQLRVALNWATDATCLISTQTGVVPLATAPSGAAARWAAASAATRCLDVADGADDDVESPHAQSTRHRASSPQTR